MKDNREMMKKVNIQHIESCLVAFRNSNNSGEKLNIFLFTCTFSVSYALKDWSVT